MLLEKARLTHLDDFLPTIFMAGIWWMVLCSVLIPTADDGPHGFDALPSAWHRQGWTNEVSTPTSLEEIGWVRRFSGITDRWLVALHDTNTTPVTAICFTVCSVSTGFSVTASTTTQSPKLLRISNLMLTPLPLKSQHISVA
jgi:hypothetical protein